MIKKRQVLSNADMCRQALLQTIVYSDLFNFPLTKEELWYYLKFQRSLPENIFLAGLKKLPVNIACHRGYYCIALRKSIITRRDKRREINKNKFFFARKVAEWLAYIPTVLFIGISGSVAMENADPGDDLDLFIIAKRNTIWATRLLCLLILQLIGHRRSRKTINEEDTVCINMIIDEKHLALPLSRRDVFTAHEIAQLVPLLSRSRIYWRFLKANSWIKVYMPNILPMANLRYKKFKVNEAPAIKHSVIFSSRIFEKASKIFQLWFINKHRTTEEVSDLILAFHPHDHRRDILERYNKKVSAFNNRRKYPY